jgi:tetratricopeptide (TPR) repeat protein
LIPWCPWRDRFGFGLSIHEDVAKRYFDVNRWKRRLVALGLLAGVVSAFYAEEDIRGALAWRRYKAPWEARGEKFDIAAFIPPPVPDERNFAMTPVVSSCYSRVLDRQGHLLSRENTAIENLLDMPVGLGRNIPTNGTGNWQKARCINLDAWQRYYWGLAHPTNQLTNATAPQDDLYTARYARRYGNYPMPRLQDTNAFPVPPRPQTPAADVLLALSKYDATIEKLRQAAGLPDSRFPLDRGGENLSEAPQPYLQGMEDCAALLQLRALAELEGGRSEAALADIGLMLRLTGKIRSEPFLSSQLVRISILQTTAQPIWEGLVKHRWQEPQLSALDRQLAGFDFVADLRFSIRVEIARQVAVTEYCRRHPTAMFDTGGSGFDRLFSVLLAHGLPSGWFQRSKLSSAKLLLEEFLPAADAERQTISPALLKKAGASVRQTPLTPFTIIPKALLQGLMADGGNFAYAQAIVNLSRTSCALERYRLAQGNYPAKLDALVPQYIDQVPHDPVDGQPLRYHVTDEDHFLLYSIGWNERDDGGTVSVSAQGEVDQDAGDWVWRSPE